MKALSQLAIIFALCSLQAIETRVLRKHKSNSSILQLTDSKDATSSWLSTIDSFKKSLISSYSTDSPSSAKDLPSINTQFKNQSVSQLGIMHHDTLSKKYEEMEDALQTTSAEQASDLNTRELAENVNIQIPIFGLYCMRMILIPCFFFTYNSQAWSIFTLLALFAVYFWIMYPLLSLFQFDNEQLICSLIQDLFDLYVYLSNILLHKVPVFKYVEGKDKVLLKSFLFLLATKVSSAIYVIFKGGNFSATSFPLDLFYVTSTVMYTSLNAKYIDKSSLENPKLIFLCILHIIFLVPSVFQIIYQWNTYMFFLALLNGFGIFLNQKWPSWIENATS